MTWPNAIIRLIIGPIVVGIGDHLLGGIHFAAPSQWIAVGLVMATISIWLDTVFLDRLGWLGAAAIEALLVAGILRITPSLMPESVTNRICSLVIGAMFGVVEAVMHWSLFGSPGRLGRSRVRPNG